MFSAKTKKTLWPTVFGGIVFIGLIACDVPSKEESDAGPIDSGTMTNPDSGKEFLDSGADEPDAGHDEDSGVPDAGIFDAGISDAGTPDSGIPDSGIPDAGTLDAGAARLFVFTGSGNGQVRTFAFDTTAETLTSLATTAAGSGANFLAVDVAGRRLYATNTNSDEIAAFRINPVDAGLTFLNRVSSGGQGPAHVSSAGDFVLAANYGSGHAAVLPVVPGGLQAPTQIVMAGGQAHQIITDDSRHFAYVACKAADHLAQYSFNGGTLTPLAPATLATQNGAGPRHLALHPTLPNAYLINEVDSTIQTLSISPSGTMTSEQTVSTLPSDFTSANTAAEVAVHPNGHFVFGSNRGHNSIATWSVNPTNGRLTLVSHTPTGGTTPRHFSLDPEGRWLIVGNQGSNSLNLFRVNPNTGALLSKGSVATVTAPTFAGFVDLR